LKRELEDHFENDAKRFNDTMETAKLLFKGNKGDNDEIGKLVKNRIHDHLKE